MLKRISNSLIVLLFIFSINLIAQDNTQNIPPNLDSYVNKVLKTFNVPGVSIAIVKDGKVLLTKGYGIKTIGKSDPVDKHTLFGIASNSKAFTATALALLVEDGKIKWDDPVINYLPWFRLSSPYVTSELTVKDLLVHRSGLGLGAGDLLLWPSTDLTRDEIVRKIKDVPLATSFRNNFAYDNVLYLVAGELISTVSGMSWEKFIKTRILQPLGMDETIADISLLPEQKNVATTHAEVEGKLKIVKPYLNNVTDPAGGINSNAVDLAKWMITQLDSGKAPDGTTLFNPETTSKLWQFVTPIGVSKAPKELAPLQQNFFGYGLGFFITDFRGHKMVYHTGGLAGYVSKITLIPDLKLGVAVLTNQESGYAFSSITYPILDYYLKADKFDWLSGYEKLKDKRDTRIAEAEGNSINGRDSASKPSLPLEKYAGTYKDAWYGDINISLDENHLVIRFSHSPDLVGDLEHWQYDTFVARWRDRELRADAYVTFSLNPDGSINHIKMKAFSPATDFSYDFRDLLLKPVK